MRDLTSNYNQLQDQIQTICRQNNITHQIELIAVSKTFPIKDIASLNTSTKHMAFGENYAQEFYNKVISLKSYPLQWHFIGSIQSNKIKLIAPNASWIHSLCDAKHAFRLNKERPPYLPKLNVLIEVNISNDENKDGLNSSGQIDDLAKIIATQDKLCLRGLMGISGINADNDTKNQQFKNLKMLFEQLKSSGFDKIDTLSMGMSGDFELAIQNGATMIRIGSSIFGPRI